MSQCDYTDLLMLAWGSKMNSPCRICRPISIEQFKTKLVHKGLMWVVTTRSLSFFQIEGNFFLQITEYLA